MVIPHFRKGQINREIAVLGITKSVKKDPRDQNCSCGAHDCDFMDGGVVITEATRSRRQARWKICEKASVRSANS